MKHLLIHLRERLQTFIHSAAMFYLVAGLLVLVFFLPDLIGTVPALICGAIVIALAICLYNLWGREKSDSERAAPPDHDDRSSS